MAVVDPIEGCSAQTVLVSRDGFGDPRRVRVPLGEISGVCIAVASGGKWEWLPEPSLAVYVPAVRYPAKWRSGKHAGSRATPNMLMLVERDGTAPDVFEALLEAGRRRVHTREFVERKRAKLARRRAAREARV